MKKKTSKAKKQKPIRAWLVVDKDGFPFDCTLDLRTADLLRLIMNSQHQDLRPFRVIPFREVTK